MRRLTLGWLLAAVLFMALQGAWAMPRMPGAALAVAAGVSPDAALAVTPMVTAQAKSTHQTAHAAHKSAPCHTPASGATDGAASMGGDAHHCCAWAHTPQALALPAAAPQALAARPARAWRSWFCPPDLRPPNCSAI